VRRRLISAGPRALASIPMDEQRLELARQGLDRLQDDPLAARAREFLDIAVEHSLQRPSRWPEQLCYALRETLESIPPLFGQPRQQEPLGPIARQFNEDISLAIDVGRPPEVLRRLVSEFQEQLRTAETTKRQRVAQAMISEAGGGMSTPQLDAFANEWAVVLGGVNSILHGGEHSPEEALAWLDRAVELIAVVVGPISSHLEDIDGFLGVTAPTEADVRRLLDLLADTRLARYFFYRADSPTWLEALEAEGLFDPPMQGDDWYQGDFLVRVSSRAPELARSIVARIVSDPHAASILVVLGVARELGAGMTDLATAALRVPTYANTFGVAHELEALIEKWGQNDTTGTFNELADVVLEPQAGLMGRLQSKLGEHEFGRLVRLFVSRSTCEDLASLAQKLSFKLKRAVRLSDGSIRLFFGRDFVSSDDSSDRDVGNALISGVRDVLRRMRQCGIALNDRESALGVLDSEILIRIWADHLAEEEESGS
jgi:hypothetical protein